MIGATLRKLGRQAAVYSAGDLLVKSLSFLLLPVLLRVWPPESPEMGTYGMLHLAEAVSYILFNMGLALAVIKVLADYRHGRARGSVVFTTVALLGTLSLGLMVLGWMAVPFVVGPLFGGLIPADDAILFLRLTLLATYLSTYRFVTLSLLRVEERPWLYTALNVVNFSVYVGTALFLVVGEGIGVLGIVYANVTSSVVMLALCLFLLQSRARRPFSGAKARGLLAFGLPLLPNGLALWALALLDRWLLMQMTPIPPDLPNALSVVGVYDVAYRFGMIVSILLVVPLRTAWVPTIYQIRDHADAPELYGRMLTYVVALGALIALPLSVLSSEIVFVVSRGSYMAAAGPLPVIAFAYLAYGISQVADAGILARGRTRIYPLITASSVVVNVALCILLIPSGGMMGAAWATLGAYAWHSLLIGRASWRIIPFSVEWRRLLQVAAAAAVVLWAAGIVPEGWSLSARIGTKTGLLLLYPAGLWISGFFSVKERAVFARVRPGGQEPPPADAVPDDPEGGPS